MKISYRAAAAAFAVSCALAGTAFAAPIDAHRESVTIRVSHTGLDLATAAGRARFNARVRRAAGYACAPRGAAIDLRVDSERCVAEMLADAEVQVAAIVKSGRVQLAAR